MPGKSPWLQPLSCQLVKKMSRAPFAMRRSGVRSPSAPPFNLITFNTYRTHTNKRPKSFDVTLTWLTRIFLPKHLFLLGPVSKCLMKTMVVSANPCKLSSGLRTGYAEVCIPFCQRVPHFEITSIYFGRSAGLQ